MSEEKGQEALVENNNGSGPWQSPKEIMEELGPTALFLRTTTARKASVLAQSRAAKLKEEENARLAAERKRKHIQKMLRQASLSGMFRMQPMLPKLQNGRAEFEEFLFRRSVLGLNFDDLLESDWEIDFDGDGIPDHTPEQKHAETKDEEKKHEEKDTAALIQRITTTTEKHVKSKKRVLSFEELQRIVVHYDTDYRALIHKSSDAIIKKKIDQFVASRNDEDTDDGIYRKPVFNSDQALLTRENLKHSPRLEALVTLFWFAADHDHTNTMTKEKYLNLTRKLQIAILGMHDPGFGAELALRDWELDSNGAPLLSFAKLKLSLFQLADMFADTLNENTYCDFLTTIAYRIIRLDPAQEKRLILRRDSYIITRKTYEFLQHEHSKWQPFPMPETPTECRKFYGQSAAQIEDIANTNQPNSNSAKDILEPKNSGHLGKLKGRFPKK